jgi:hypothetical protein
MAFQLSAPRVAGSRKGPFRWRIRHIRTFGPRPPPKLNDASKDLSSFLHFEAHFGALLVDKGHLQHGWDDFVQIFCQLF